MGKTLVVTCSRRKNLPPRSSLTYAYLKYPPPKEGVPGDFHLIRLFRRVALVMRTILCGLRRDNGCKDYASPVLTD
jgi:hypothetical protein